MYFVTFEECLLLSLSSSCDITSYANLFRLNPNYATYISYWQCWCDIYFSNGISLRLHWHCWWNVPFAACRHHIVSHRILYIYAMSKWNRSQLLMCSLAFIVNLTQPFNGSLALCSCIICVYTLTSTSNLIYDDVLRNRTKRSHMHSMRCISVISTFHIIRPPRTYSYMFK